jgi:hypothetical protein
MLRLELESKETLLVPRAVVMHFGTLTPLLEMEPENSASKGKEASDETVTTLPILGIDMFLETLEKVCDYYRQYLQDSTGLTWKSKYWEQQTTEDIKRIILAANYLAAEELLHDTAKYIASTLENQTPEDIRKMWGLPDDLTEDEKKEMYEEYSWLLDL